MSETTPILGRIDNTMTYIPFLALADNGLDYNRRFKDGQEIFNEDGYKKDDA